MSDEQYEHWTGRLVYTMGVKWLCDQAGAHWLCDIIASHQTDPKAKAEEFQHWTLVVAADQSATVTMTDGNSDKPIIQQTVPWTDYAEDRCELYLVATPGQPAILMQPCEY